MKTRWLCYFVEEFMKKILILLAATAIAHVHAAFGQQAEAPQPQPQAPKASSSSYRLRPMDVITMTVFQEPELTNVENRISTDGTITLPLIEKVNVAGLTRQEAEDKITELYKKDYFVNPYVSLTIRAYAKQSCYVMGWVNMAREYVFPDEEGDNMTITKVIAGCNGFSPRANRTDVMVRRRLPNGKEEIYNIDVKEILRNRGAADFPIKNGDIIEVKEDIF